MSEQQQPYRGIPNASEMSHYGGVSYTPPDRVESRSHDDVVPFSRAGRAWRLALAVVFAIVGIAGIVTTIIQLALADHLAQASTLVGIVGPGMFAVLLLIYPAVTVVRMRHHTL